MFINQRFFPAATLYASPPLVNRNRGSEVANPGDRLHKPPTSSSSHNTEERRVLGFDVFSLESSRRSSVDLDTWRGAEANEEDNIFPAPGLAWNSNAPNIKFLSNKPPAWFPWVPTKSQIESLKVVELKAACDERGLSKTGSKALLQERLLQWTTDQQQQHQARITGDFITSWFEDVTISAESTATTTDDIVREKPRSPDSLADWSRSVDLESLYQKRQEIHRQKRQGRRPSPKKTAKQQTQESSKEYLLKLSKALKAPSSPYASNVKVKELYTASKEADQLGERKVAIDLLETLLRVTPNDARIYRRLSRMYSEQGDLSKARATLQLGLRRQPENPWLLHGMGHLELTHGCAKEKARSFFEKAIDADPTFAHSYHALGTLEHTNGNIARAMKVLKQGVEYCPTNHRLHHALGDLYRGAKLLKDAERSYLRALEHSPPVSNCFAYSALASVAYERRQVGDARAWLHKSLKVNDGRHAQGWVSLAHMEEAEGNTEKARLICMAAIEQYERGLIEMRQRYKKQYKKGDRGISAEQSNRGPLINAVEIKNLLLRAVPRYRSGDKFLKVYRNWARLEERYGSFESVDQVYERASVAFPLEYKLTLDWARYHAAMKNHDRARSLYMEAVNKASNRHADPYRIFAEMEMSLGNYEQARKLLFRGAQAVSQSSDGGLGNRRGLAELFHTWAICEWHLNNLPRAEVLFDHALRLTDAGEEGSRLRSFVLYSIARLEYFRDELHLAQHCIGLCLKENLMPGGNAIIWELWANIARDMNNEFLEEECLEQAEAWSKMQESDDLSRLLSTSSISARSGMKDLSMGHLMKREPWQFKLFGNSDATSSNFYSNVKFPDEKYAAKAPLPLLAEYQ